MLERLKQYPLVGLALAIAAGLMLAHVLIKMGDNLYENNADLLVIHDYPLALANLVIATVVLSLSLVVWKRQSILSWLGRHKRGLAFSVAGVCVCCVGAVLYGIHQERLKPATRPTIALPAGYVLIPNTTPAAKASPNSEDDKESIRQIAAARALDPRMSTSSK